METGGGGNFTVISYYLVSGCIFEGGLGSREERVFGEIWKSSTPSKVVLFR